MNALKLYVYDKDGYHGEANWIKGDALSTSKAILYFSSQGNLIVTDIMDQAQIITSNKRIVEFRETDDSTLELLDLMRQFIPLKDKGIVIEDPNEFIIPEGELGEYLGLNEEEPEI
jgi:hypothetical protein